MMPIDETLKIPGAATANEDPKDGHQQQQPLGVYAPLGAPASPAVPAGRHSDRDSQKAGLKGTRAVPTKPAPEWPHQWSNA